MKSGHFQDYVATLAVQWLGLAQPKKKDYVATPEIRSTPGPLFVVAACCGFLLFAWLVIFLKFFCKVCVFCCVWPIQVCVC